MATITKPNTFVSGTTILAAAHNSNFDTIYNDYNGNITNANLSGSAGIIDANLAQITTANKVASTAITDGDLDIAALTCSSTHFEETTAPTTAASEGALYTKDTGGQPELFYREESDGTEVQITSGGALNSGAIVQVVNAQDGAVATGTTLIPFDNTIPQSGEGDEYMTLAITPTSATNELRIDVVTFISSGAAAGNLSTALFQDATADSLAAGAAGPDAASSGNMVCIKFTHYMIAGTTSATTFKVHAGSDEIGTTTFNGVTATVVFGGVMASSITITEIVV